MISTQSDTRLVANFRRFSAVAAVVTTVAGGLALLGWTLSIPILEQLLPGQTSMKPLSALGFLLAGIALWLLRTHAGQGRLAPILAGLAGLIGALTLAEYVLGLDLGIDQLLFTTAVRAEGSLPLGRPAPATTLCLVLLGVALLALDAKPAWLAQLSAVAALTVAELALIGYVYEVANLYQVGPYVPIAPYTAGVFVVLSLGVLAARPEGPISGVFTTNLAGSAFGLRLLPAVLVLPVMVGGLHLVGERLGLINPEFAVPLLITSNAVLFATMMYVSARLLNQADARREATMTALRESEERYRIVADATPNGLITVAEGGEITWANRRAEAFFGYDTGQLAGCPIDRLVPARLQDRHRADREQFALDRQVRPMGVGRDLFGLRKDGTAFPVEIGLSPIETSAGKLTLATITDITERKQAEIKLMQSHATLRSTIESVSVPIFALDRDFRHTAFNRAHAATMKALYGAEIEIGHSLLDYQTVPADRERARAHLQRALQGDAFVIADDSGEAERSRRYFEISHNPIRSHDGEVIGVVVLSTDVTERKQAEDRLLEMNLELERRVEQRKAELAVNEAKFRTLFDVLPVGVSLLDAHGRIVDSNPALGQIMKLSLESRAQAAYAARPIIHPDGTPVRAEELPSARAFKEQRPVLNVEMGVVTETGDTIWTNVSAAPLPVPGMSVVVVTADVTEHKRAEVRLQSTTAWLRSIVDANVIGVTRADEYGRQLEVNDYYLNLLGYTRADFEAGLVNWRERTPPEYMPLEERAIAELKARGVCTPFEKEYTRKDGSRAWVYLSNALLPDGTISAFVLDVTQRKRAEQALRESEQRYRALFEEAQQQARDLSLLNEVRQAVTRELELPLVLRAVVEGVAGTFGYALVSLYLLEGEALRLQHQVGYEKTIERIAVSEGVTGRVARTAQPVLLEDVRSEPAFLGAIEGITSEICVPLFDQGRVAGILNVESARGVKLTEADLKLLVAVSGQVGIAIGRARLYAEVSESQQLFQGAFSYASTGMALVGLDGRYLQVNRALCGLVGYTEEELLATSFQAITHPDDLEADLAYVRQVLAGDIASYQMEKRYFHKRGHVVWSLLSVSLVRDAAGQPRYFIAQIQDITKRKRAEAALAHERDLMQALMDNIPDTIYFKDVASRFTRINRAQARFLGLADPAAAMGKTDLDLHNPEYAQEVYAQEQRLFASGEPVLNRIEFMPTADGQPRWISSTKVPLREGDRVVGLVGISRDITAVKQTELRLAASLQEKEVLLKEIHHRVKNNLQVISSLLRLQAETVSDPAMRDLFEESQRRVRSMALIHEQLYQSRDLAHIDFGEYVEGLVSYLRRSHARTVPNLQMRVAIQGVTLGVDLATPLGLLINELVTNSLKYAFPPEAGVEPAEILVAAERDPAGTLSVVVADTGVGLPEALDLDKPTSMGMQLVQSFVSQLRGRLTVQRRPGTVYTVTIPERKAARG